MNSEKFPLRLSIYFIFLCNFGIFIFSQNAVQIKINVLYKCDQVNKKLHMII